MARPFVAPDPKDRSVNEPTCVVSAAQVVGLYNQENSGDKKERVVDSVKEWYKAEMEKYGWEKATFHGNQCVLEAKVQLVTKAKK
jgi:hypothetical protein